MGLDRIFGSTVEFLLHETNGDPVALLRSIADYIHRLTPVNQRFTCSRECLLRAAAETSFLQGKPQAQHCSRCKELQADQTHKTAEPFALIASEEFRSSFEISSAPSPRDGHSKQPTSTGETNEPISSTSHAPQSNSEDFTFQVGHVVRPVASGASSSSSEQSQTESHFQSRAPALVANQRVCFEDQVGVSDQECPTQKPVAGGSRSKPLVPSLHLKGPAASPRTGPAAVGTKTSKGNFRLIQSARGARPEASSRQLLDSPKGSKHGDLSERGRPHTSGMNGEPHAEPSGDGSESEGSSPRKDKGVKELMTPDEHIKEWLAEKKRKEARRERHVRRRQLKELEFIAALRKTQARRLRHLQEVEGKLDFAGSEAEVLFKKESAQARYRSLKGSV